MIQFNDYLTEAPYGEAKIEALYRKAVKLDDDSQSTGDELGFFKKYMKFGGTFYKYIETILDPVKCGFKLVKSGDTFQSQGGREVWTASPCVLVKVDKPILF